jgi:hypothetical protein
MAPKTIARSNLARSNAARSGWPTLVGTKVKLFALSKVARSGATRSNYHNCQTFITMNGQRLGAGAVVGGPGILAKSVTVNDSMNNVPTTAQLTFYKIVPVEGNDLIITLGSVNNRQRELAGTILSVVHRYVGDLPVDRNMVYDAQLIDYTWGLGRKKVSGKYTNNSVATIAAAILAGATQYTLQVDSDIGAILVNEITFTEQTVDDALHQLVTRVGGDYECDYLRVVHLFLTYKQDTPPALINRAHRSMRDLVWTRDLSQVVTRVYHDCGGSNALEQIGPGETLIPVETAAWYETAGGVVLVNQQRVNYAGVVLGGGGALVGPGAAPTAAINAAVVPGSGVTAGAHDYAVSYVTASGESLPGPRVSVVSGVIAPPTAGPALDTSKPLLAGNGPAPGAHDYAMTFVASTGETTPGPRVTINTGLVTPPTTGPTPAAGAVGPGPDDGAHDYAVSFVTAQGQSTPSPIGGQIQLAGTPVPAPGAPTANTATTGGAVDIGQHWYGVTFVTARGETTVGNGVMGEAFGQGKIADPAGAPGVTDGSGNNTVSGGNAAYMYAYRGGGGQTLTSPSTDYVLTLVSSFPITYRNVSITVPASPDPNCTGIVLYRANGYNPPRSYFTEIATFSNVQSTFTDNFSSSSGATPPANNNTTVTGSPRQTIPIRTIPIGPAGVIARKLYRTDNKGSAPKFLVTINNNSTTSYDDAAADSTLGAVGPGSNTAYVSTAVHLTNIARAIGSDAGAVTSRNLWRRSAGAGLRFLATIADNSASTYDDTIANSALGAAPPSANTAYLQQIPLTLPLGGPFIVNRNLYRTKIGSSTLLIMASLDNVVTTFLDTVLDGNLGAAAPTTNGAAAAQVNLSAIPIGAASVTQRRLYRTAADASQLKLLTGLGDNTTTAISDTQPDAALGANAPTSDTSLLQQPTGNVLAGATALPLASVASFRAAGGWAIVASQIVRYTGISGNNLSGVPATGIGSIGATITFNVSAIAAPMLIGVPTTGTGTIRYTIFKGDPVDVFVQVDDLAAQAAVRAQLPGSDGIIEDELQDRRLSATEGRARAQARLALLAARDSTGKVGLISVTYTCRDINTRAGRTVTINLGPPINLSGDFQIQRVTESKFYVPSQPPTYVVEASSVRFSYEQLLRIIGDAAGA